MRRDLRAFLEGGRRYEVWERQVEGGWGAGVARD